MEKHIELYPSIEKVFKDKTLGFYFRPLLTVKTSIANKAYNIHLVATDGLYCKEQHKYSENNFFGFKYNNGLYEFLGDLSIFEEYDKIPELYNFLQEDFIQNRDSYLKEKTTVEKYLEKKSPELKNIVKSDFFSNAAYYAEALYSYNFTKYYYENYGIHKHISVITENYSKNTDPFLLEEADASSILEEFFINLNYNLNHDYEIKKEMFVSGTERYRFMSIIGGGCVLSLVDPTKDIVYILEYFS
jgi:hypothetical protein